MCMSTSLWYRRKTLSFKGAAKKKNEQRAESILSPTFICSRALTLYKIDYLNWMPCTYCTCSKCVILSLYYKTLNKINQCKHNDNESDKANIKSLIIDVLFISYDMIYVKLLKQTLKWHKLIFFYPNRWCNVPECSLCDFMLYNCVQHFFLELSH